MNITKLGHSCVLVATEDRVALFDPSGWAERELLDRVEHIDRIVYTHQHADHFDVEILRDLVRKFPNALVICGQSITELIEQAGLSVTTQEESGCTHKFDAPHEQLPVPGAQAPAENGYHFKEIFTHPGDSQSFNETKSVLAMPFIGPWGKTGDSIAKVLELKPKYVLPIHDWHYTDEAKQWLQGMLKSVFEPAGIELLPNNNGQEIKLDI
ncbi:MAG: MBL fold metallo-hydrolase [Cumulibacter sp.]